jgi:DNA repair protein RecN (Recombination protein N)
MLHELAITDFAIIQQVRLRLAPGLAIFTGETGAGKSMVLDAIGALLGDRAGPEMVRTGASRAVIEGIFVLPWLPDTLAALEREPESDAEDDDEQRRPDPHRELAALVRESGLQGDDDALIITREIAAAGRSTARVNGRAVPLGVLARLGALLVDVHGQGAHLALLRPERHIDYLDRFAEILPQRSALAEKVRIWRQHQSELAALRADERALERRAELLRFQVDEIAAAALRSGEIADLERERDRLANAEHVRGQSALAHATLAGSDDGETPGALDLLAATERALADLARIDPTLEETRAALDESRFRLEDVAATLRDYRDSAEADPGRLAAIEERLDRIHRLQRKYGATIEEIVAFGAEAARELEQIEHRDERIAALEAIIERERDALGAQAAALSSLRREAAARLAEQMERAIDTLNMRQARFFVQIERQPAEDGVSLPGEETRVAIAPTGIDRVEFLIAPNPGEPPRPLAKTASGGETSRLMLAIKSILARADATPTLIFDEVDAGIGGLTGQVVGDMLWRLGHSHQVLCVTHLPQLAAFGDQHWHVAKRVIEGRTITVVTELHGEARVREIAQMLGGVATATAERNAAELLERAAAWQQGRPPSSDLPAANGAPPPAKSRRASRAQHA